MRVSGSFDDMPAEALSMLPTNVRRTDFTTTDYGGAVSLKGKQPNIQNAPQIMPPMNDLGTM